MAKNIKPAGNERFSKLIYYTTVFNWQNKMNNWKAPEK